MKSELLNAKTLKNKLAIRPVYLWIKKLCALLGLFIVSLNFVISQNYDFRKTSWGMNNKQVIAAEMPNKGVVEGKTITYKVKVIDTKFTLIYTFNEKNELVSAIYVLDKNYIDHNFYVTEFNKFNELITKKYGTPEKNEQYWNVEIKDRDSSNWANSLESGYLQLNAEWKTPKTIIDLFVSKYDIVHLIIKYKARNFKDYNISKLSTDDI